LLKQSPDNKEIASSPPAGNRRQLKSNKICVLFSLCNSMAFKYKKIIFKNQLITWKR